MNENHYGACTRGFHTRLCPDYALKSALCFIRAIIRDGEYSFLMIYRFCQVQNRS